MFACARLVQPTFITNFHNPSPSAIDGIVAAFSAGGAFGAYGCAIVADRFGCLFGVYFVGADFGSFDLTKSWVSTPLMLCV